MIAVFKNWAIKFRPMVEADVPEVVEIERSAYAFPWNEGTYYDCMRAGYSVWILEYRKQIGAYGVLSSAAGEAHLLNICVRPTLHGKGLGRAMLEHLIEVARSQRADMMFLEVRPSNLAAIQLYQSVGFAEIGTRRAYYPALGGREDALIFAIQFVPPEHGLKV
jgi:ribosomal-protein-alanine N-acetyltransferase